MGSAIKHLALASHLSLFYGSVMDLPNNVFFWALETTASFLRCLSCLKPSSCIWCRAIWGTATCFASEKRHTHLHKLDSFILQGQGAVLIIEFCFLHNLSRRILRFLVRSYNTVLQICTFSSPFIWIVLKVNN